MERILQMRVFPHRTQLAGTTADRFIYSFCMLEGSGNPSNVRVILNKVRRRDTASPWHFDDWWGYLRGKCSEPSVRQPESAAGSPATRVAQDNGEWAETLTVSPQTLPRVTKINLFIPPHWINIKVLLPLTSLSHPEGKEFVVYTVKIIY